MVGEEEGCKLAAFVKKQMRFLVENAAGVSFDMDVNRIHLLCSSTDVGLAYKFCFFFVVKFVKQLREI